MYFCPVVNCNKEYTDPSSLRKHLLTQYGKDVYDIATNNKKKNGDNGDYGKIDLDQLKAQGIEITPKLKQKKSKPRANSPKQDSDKFNPQKMNNETYSDSSSYGKYNFLISKILEEINVVDNNVYESKPTIQGTTRYLSFKFLKKLFVLF